MAYKARKRKVKKNIPNGVAHICSTFNNTIVSITDKEGNVVSWASAGTLGIKGSKKSTFYEFLSMGIVPYLVGSATFMALFGGANKYFDNFVVDMTVEVDLNDVHEDLDLDFVSEDDMIYGGEKEFVKNAVLKTRMIMTIAPNVELHLLKD